MEANKSCCYNCKFFYGESGGTVHQPYPEFMCGKGHWDGIESTDDLFDEIDCKDFELKHSGKQTP